MCSVVRREIRSQDGKIDQKIRDDKVMSWTGESVRDEFIAGITRYTLIAKMDLKVLQLSKLFQLVEPFRRRKTRIHFCKVEA